jgi:hypothetical protein
MLRDLTEILVPIFGMLTSFSSIFGIFYIYMTIRNKERMALIENGLNPKAFENQENNGLKRWILRLSLIAIGIALGILFAFVIVEAFYIGSLRKVHIESVLYPACIFLFGGLGLLSSYFVELKLDKKEKS